MHTYGKRRGWSAIADHPPFHDKRHVKRQYCGTAGKRENCQVDVFVAYASPAGRTVLDRELYLPQEWADDPVHRTEAGVPETVAFVTKPKLARQLLERILDGGVPTRWVTADCVYGADYQVRIAVVTRQLGYVVGVTSTQSLWVWERGVPWQRPIREVVERVAPESWTQLSATDGAKGPRVYDWAWGPIRESVVQAG